MKSLMKSGPQDVAPKASESLRAATSGDGLAKSLPVRQTGPGSVQSPLGYLLHSIVLAVGCLAMAAVMLFCSNYLGLHVAREEQLLKEAILSEIHIAMMALSFSFVIMRISLPRWMMDAFAAMTVITTFRQVWPLWQANMSVCLMMLVAFPVCLVVYVGMIMLTRDIAACRKMKGGAKR